MNDMKIYLGSLSKYTEGVEKKFFLDIQLPLFMCY